MKTRTETLNKAYIEGHSPAKYGKMIDNLKKYMPCIPQARAEHIACTIMFSHAIDNSKKSIGSYNNEPINEVIEVLLNDMLCTYLIQGAPTYDEYSDAAIKEELIIIEYHFNDNVTIFEFMRQRSIYTKQLFNCKLLSIKTY